MKSTNVPIYLYRNIHEQKGEVKRLQLIPIIELLFLDDEKLARNCVNMLKYQYD